MDAPDGSGRHGEQLSPDPGDARSGVSGGPRAGPGRAPRSRPARRTAPGRRPASTVCAPGWFGAMAGNADSTVTPRHGFTGRALALLAAFAAWQGRAAHPLPAAGCTGKRGRSSAVWLPVKIEKEFACPALSDHDPNTPYLHPPVTARVRFRGFRCYGHLGLGMPESAPCPLIAAGFCERAGGSRGA